MEIVIVAPADFVFGVKRNAQPGRFNNLMGDYPQFRAVAVDEYMEGGRACAVVACSYEGALDDREAVLVAMRDINSKFTPTRILGASDGSQTSEFARKYIESQK